MNAATKAIAVAAVLLSVVALPVVADAPAEKPAAEPKKDLTATVVSVSGPAQKMVLDEKGQGKWAPLAKGDKLSEMTMVRTGLRAKVVLDFEDRGKVVINRATKFGIREFRRKGSLTKARVGLKYGTINAKVDSTQGPNDFKVATPVATLSVRGTSGDVGFTGDVGLGLQGKSGWWQLRSGNKQHNVGKGEGTKGTKKGNFLLALKLQMGKRQTQLGDATSRGLTKSEKINQLMHGSGRGGIGFNGSGGGGSKDFRTNRLTGLKRPDDSGSTENGTGEPGYP